MTKQSKSNPGFNAEKAADCFFNILEDQALVERIKQLEKKCEEEKERPPDEAEVRSIFSHFAWKAVAGILLLAIAVFAINVFNSNSTSVDYLSLVHGVEAFRLEKSEGKPYSDIDNDILNKDYAAAQLKLEKVSGEMSALNFRKGIVAVKTLDFKNAEKYFRNIIDAQSVMFSEKAYWNLLLVYLAEGKTPEAQKLYEEMENSSNVSANTKTEARELILRFI